MNGNNNHLFKSEGEMPFRRQDLKISSRDL